MRAFLISVVMITLAGCATYKPVPDGYSGPTASIKDTYVNKTATSAHYFELNKVNGKYVSSSFGETRGRNYGRGMIFDPVMVEREVLPEEQVFTIVGHVFFPTDAQLLFGNTLKVEGTVKFVPEAGETYLVRGSISESISEVWIENSRGKIVGEKISKVHE